MRKSLPTRRFRYSGKFRLNELSYVSEKRPFTAANPLMNPGIVQQASNTMTSGF